MTVIPKRKKCKEPTKLKKKKRIFYYDFHSLQPSISTSVGGTLSLLTFKSNLGLVNYSGSTTGDNKDSDQQRKITDFLLALQQLSSVPW